MPGRVENWLASRRGERSPGGRDRLTSRRGTFGGDGWRAWRSLVPAIMASLFLALSLQAAAEGGGGARPSVRSAAELERGRSAVRRVGTEARQRLPDGGNRRFKLGAAPDDAELSFDPVLAVLAALLGVGLPAIWLLGRLGQKQRRAPGAARPWPSRRPAGPAPGSSQSLHIFEPTAPR